MKKLVKFFTLFIFVFPCLIFLSSCGKEKYTVTFDSDGGSAVAFQTILKGDKIQEPIEPTKNGYTFDGWYYGDEKWSFIGYVVTENIILKAKWIDIFIVDTNKIIGLTDYGKTLNNIIIPSYINGIKITNINEKAFEGISNITSIEIPSSVTTIGWCAFYECNNLIDIYYGGTLSDWCNIEFSNFSNPMSYNSENITKHFYIKDKNKNYKELTEIEIPSDITKVTAQKFIGFNNVTKVVIPNNIISIEGSAFAFCRSLVSIEIPSSVKNIGDGAFWGCKNLTNILFPEDSELTIIGDHAFYDCISLTNIEIPSSVTSIGNYAFCGCSDLTCIFYSGTLSDWSSISIGSNNSYLTSATIYYFSETKPTKTGNYWHYVDGVVTKW